eukprot:1300364-Rhodomonas_salina.1
MSQNRESWQDGNPPQPARALPAKSFRMGEVDPKLFVLNYIPHAVVSIDVAVGMEFRMYAEGSKIAEGDRFELATRLKFALAPGRRIEIKRRIENEDRFSSCPAVHSCRCHRHFLLAAPRAKRSCSTYVPLSAVINDNLAARLSPPLVPEICCAKRDHSLDSHNGWPLQHGALSGVGRAGMCPE